jgi:hypothetical protein
LITLKIIVKKTIQQVQPMKNALKNKLIWSPQFTRSPRFGILACQSEALGIADLNKLCDELFEFFPEGAICFLLEVVIVAFTDFIYLKTENKGFVSGVPFA